MYTLDNVEWTIDYFKWMNKRAEELGMSYLKVIIDEKNKIIYKDSIHQLLGIGIKVEN